MKDSSSPAQHVLESYLQESLSDPTEHREDYEIQIDILYLLTDKTAHRRALAEEPLLKEISQIRPPDLHLPTATRVLLKEALQPLLEGRLITRYESGFGYDQYELAHDFLVRSVLRSWSELDRQRTEKLAILRQKRAEVEERLNRLARLERTANWSLRILPLVVFSLFIWLTYLGIKRELPLWLGLSILWLIACPSAVVLVMAMARRAPTGLLFGLLAMAACVAIRWYEQTLPVVPLSRPSPTMTLPVNDCQLLTRHLLSRSSSPNSYTESQAQDILFSNCRRYIAFQYEDTLSASSQPENLQGVCDSFASETVRDLRALGPKSPTISPSQLIDECDSYINYENGMQNRYASPIAFTSLRPFQIGRLDSTVGWVALGVALLLLLLCPRILLDTIAVSKESERTRSTISIQWAEMIDVTPIGIVIALSIYFIGYLDLHPAWGVSVLIILLLATSIFLYKLGRTLGGLIAHISLQCPDTGVRLFFRVLLRQVLFLIWAALNIFFLLPTLILTPLLLRFRRSHQTFYDSLSGFEAIHNSSVRTPVHALVAAETMDKPA